MLIFLAFDFFRIFFKRFFTEMAFSDRTQFEYIIRAFNYQTQPTSFKVHRFIFVLFFSRFYNHGCYPIVYINIRFAIAL